MRFPRYLLPLVLLTALAANPALAATKSPLRLQLLGPLSHPVGDGWHSLVITNLTDRKITIERFIALEKRTSTGWAPEPYFRIQAISNCKEYAYPPPHKPSQPASPSTIRISPHGRLQTVRWDTWICGGQCPEPCMQNVPAGPGTYRFVVILAPSGTRIPSPSFEITRRK